MHGALSKTHSIIFLLSQTGELADKKNIWEIGRKWMTLMVALLCKFSSRKFFFNISVSTEGNNMATSASSL